MSLFVGNISRFVEQKDIEKEFRSYGDCTVDFRNSKKGKFAFIQFKNDADAEQAKRNLQGKDLQGLKLNIEWSKKSGRFDENKGGLAISRDNKRGKDDQPLNIKPKRSRSRSHRGKRKFKSRSRSRSKSYQRNRSAPKYANNSRSSSEETYNDCLRDRILKEKLREMKRAKKEKKQKEKERDTQQSDVKKTLEQNGESYMNIESHHPPEQKNEVNNIYEQ